MEFDWDENKRQAVLADRGIDFVDMTLAFDGRLRLTRSSVRHGEERRVSVAEIHGKLYVVVWMPRPPVIWIITARRAWTSESRWHARIVDTGGSDDGQNRF